MDLLTYSNFNNPDIQTQFNTELDLADIHQWGYEMPIQIVSGRAKITANYKGKITLRAILKKTLSKQKSQQTFSLQTPPSSTSLWLFFTV